MLLSLERTPLGQRILKNVPSTDAEADERRLRADIYLSPSKLELSDKVMQAIRPGLGATAGPASGTQLPPLARADIIDAKWILFQVCSPFPLGPCGLPSRQLSHPINMALL